MADKSTPISITLTVARMPRNGARSRFDVPVAGAAIRVLDALLHVREHIDPTLAFRYSCRVGMCGSCAVLINGREGLACQTTIASLNSDIVSVAPLRSLPVQRDLIVDMKPFFDSLRHADAALRPREPQRRTIRTMPPGDGNRAAIEHQNGCITCGACYSACEWTSTRPRYLGPAALNRVLMLALDERDTVGRKRLLAIASDDGALRCHTLGNCSAVCPVDVPLREGMQTLKGLLATGRTMA